MGNMIKITHKGDWSRTTKFLERSKELINVSTLDKYGKEGVAALQAVTPKDTGVTANSWGYRIEHGKDSVSIIWTNSNTVKGIPIVILLQYGHGTRNGGYVKGIDFINPAMKPIFDKLAEDAWKEVTSI